MKHFFSFVFCISLLLATQAETIAGQNMSEAVARAFTDRYPDPDVIHNVGSTNTIDWQPGYIMFALEHVWRWTGDQRYFNYIKRYVDQHIDDNGNVRQFTPTALDHFISGYACLFLYEQTGEEKYAKAAETFRRGFDGYPRTAEEMFIHGQRMPQVWVDGVFMGQIFLARYAKTLGHPEDYEEVVRQIVGASRLCGKDNGLMVHAWAEPGKGKWPGDGQSPEVWSEGLGWIAVLLADIFEWMPEDTPGADKVMTILKNLCAGLKECQDSRTGLWCQVVDKPYEDGNWNETSGSGMFTYLLQRAMDKGYVPVDEYTSVVDKAYRGLLSKCVRNTDGFYNILDCSSIGVKRNYQEYVSQTREVSCFTSFASVMLGAGAFEWRRSNPKDSPLYDFWCCDYSGGKVFHFVDGQPVWSHEAPLTNDIWVLDNGNVLFTTGNGVLELSSKGDTVFRYDSSSKVFAVQRLGNGNTFIGECTDGRLLEVNRKGRTVRSVNILPEGATKSDGFIRNARKLDSGHYLVAGYSTKKVVEYDSAGRIVWETEVKGGAHSVARTEDGHTIVSSADKDKNPCITEFDEKGKVVWKLSNDDISGQVLKFMSGFQYLPDSDSFLLTNWQGHNIKQKGPLILWVGRDKKILGSFESSPYLQTVSSVFVKVPGSVAVH